MRPEETGGRSAAGPQDLRLQVQPDRQASLQPASQSRPGSTGCRLPLVSELGLGVGIGDFERRKRLGGVHQDRRPLAGGQLHLRSLHGSHGLGK